METPKKKGFALLSEERRKEISSKGGKAAHACGRGYEFTSEAAKAAGRLGGMAVARKLRERKAKEAKPTAAERTLPLPIDNVGEDYLTDESSGS